MMYFFEQEERQKRAITVTSALAGQFLKNIRGIDGRYAVEVGASETSISYDDSVSVEDELIRAAAATDHELLREIFVERYAELSTDGDEPEVRTAWISHLLDGGEVITYGAFHERVVKERLDKLTGFEKVQDLEAPNGVWLRVTSGLAAHVATRLSSTGVGGWIASRYGDRARSACAEDPDLRLPNYYLLVDDAEAPTKAFVALAALPEADMTADAIVHGIASHGHATGYQNYNPYPEYAEDIERLAAAEKLHYEPNWMGSLIEPEATPPSP